jgi:hypothetical protein
MSRNPRVFARKWQRDLARAENREIAGVLERGLVSKQRGELVGRLCATLRARQGRTYLVFRLIPLCNRDHLRLERKIVL